MKKIVTEQDLQNNPELIERGIKAGDEIEIPDSISDDEDTGGNVPPPPKGRG